VVLDWESFVQQVLENTSSSSEHYKFAVWKNAPDETAITDEDGYILRNSDKIISNQVDIEFDVPNEVWHLVVEPVEGWSVFNEMKWQIIITLVCSIILIMLCMLLFFSEQKKIVLSQQIKQNEQKEQYMSQLSIALREAEEANAAKTTFLNNMSHDIRTPMNAIMGFTTLMEDELDEPDRLKAHLEKIKVSGEYLLTLINNVLEVARIDSGKETLDEDFTDLMDESCSVAPLLESEINRKNLIFTNEMNIQHRYVFADIQKIKEITMNLMSNAIKYTPEGGSIHLQFDELPCDEEGYAIYVNTITDTGIGMSEDFQGVIFDSFSRERNTTESKVIGTGLGMSIVKKLVDLMDGSIEVESQLGKGTTFRITMKHKIVENPEEYIEKQQKQETIKNYDLTGKTVLLAEDNELNAEIAMTLLEDIGARVELAEDGVECINMLSEKEPGYYDLILMDIQMPNLNGYQATEKIRKFDDTVKANIPILAMTANAFEEDKKKALEAGMNGHIAKPIQISILIDTISRILI